jgi:hypothetical protein
MGTFTRQGTFQDRDAFLAAVRQKLEKLMGGAAQGMTHTWEKGPGGEDIGRLAGFGAKIELTVGASDWTCRADIPAWLPIPQAMIEQKFDEKFAELSRL